jgi:alcohol dehydrogenase (cytochrome c)
MAGLACALLAGTSATRAAEVTYERLANPEPQNWLMHHHDFSGQRFSALDTIDRSNVKNLKLLFAVALGGSSKDDSLEATPLVEDGFMYMVDSSGIVSKIDVRSGVSGPIMWQMNPKQEKPDRNRGVALWNNLVISVTGYGGRAVATDKETGGVVWDKFLLDQSEVGLTELTAAPLALKDAILVASSGGDHGVRSWLVSLDPKTGNVLWKTHSVPAPGEPGSETWKDKNNAWQTGGGAFYGTGAYDPATNLTYWGSGNPVPAFDASYRPGDNLYTNSALAFDAASGKIKWYHQYTPNDNRDYDETGSHILIDTKVGGEDRRILVHPARNGFEYAFDRISGQFLKAVQTVRQVTWTKGIDPKTGKPLDYDPTRDIQLYAEPANANCRQGGAPGLPVCGGRHQFLAVVLQPQDRTPLRAHSRGLQPDHHRHQRPCDRPDHRRRGRRGRPHHWRARRHRPRFRRGEETGRHALSEFGRRPVDGGRNRGDGNDRRHHPRL